MLPHLGSDVPIVASLDDGMRYGPTALLVGIAPAGGRLPADFRAAIRAAIERRLEIVSGLHVMLNDDEEFSQLAREHDTRIWDLRLPPAAPLFSGAAWDVRAKIVLTVGSDDRSSSRTSAPAATPAARNREACKPSAASSRSTSDRSRVSCSVRRTSGAAPSAEGSTNGTHVIRKI